MPLQIKALGYTLQPGEKFVDESDCVDEEEAVKSYGKPEINLKDELLAKVREIELKPIQGDKKVPWVESLAVIATTTCDTIDKNQTLKIEEHLLYSKEIALSCVKVGLEKLNALKVKFNRPSDFYAEMLKSDGQMAALTKKLEKKQEDLLKRKHKNEKKVKNKFNKRVKELENKNKFLKDVKAVLKGKKKGTNVKEEVDKVIKKHEHAKGGAKAAAGKLAKKGKGATAKVAVKAAGKGGVKKEKGVVKVEKKKAVKKTPAKAAKTAAKAVVKGAGKGGVKKAAAKGALKGAGKVAGKPAKKPVKKLVKKVAPKKPAAKAPKKGKGGKPGKK